MLMLPSAAAPPCNDAIGRYAVDVCKVFRGSIAVAHLSFVRNRDSPRVNNAPWRQCRNKCCSLSGQSSLQEMSIFAARHIHQYIPCRTHVPNSETKCRQSGHATPRHRVKAPDALTPRPECTTRAIRVVLGLASHLQATISMSRSQSGRRRGPSWPFASGDSQRRNLQVTHPSRLTTAQSACGAQNAIQKEIDFGPQSRSN
ncbi:uncharacterized protein IWZ02DRAFT_443974 [Phyllosticta citriasiana]|uniref:Uncharacterized protein n=1 Tax=Phyllosticta citriasiana TaxID=595635 RepID=A0ABR1KMC5_9PEZI